MKIALSLILFCFGWHLCSDAYAGTVKPVVFEFDNQNDFVSRWKIRRTALHVPVSRFYVGRSRGARDGKVLIVECNKSSGIALISPHELDIRKTPVMRWRWRVVNPVVLKNGSEPDDQAAAVYICDGNSFRQFTLSYRWEQLPKIGFVRLKRYSGGAVTVYGICMENNKTPIGEWVEEERDILHDFNKFFKRDIMSRYAIGIAGNSQHTKSNTRVEIDYIEFHPRQTTKRGEK